MTRSTRPEVSVIIPVWEGEPTLERAIRSVLDQTFADLEVLVVDDASDDGSFAIATRLAAEDRRVRPMRRSVRAGGPATPRDDGIGASTGAYVAFLDQDDFWLPGKLARQLPLFATGDPAVVYSQAFFDEENQGPRVAPVDLPSGDISVALLKENRVPVLTAVVRREWVDRIGRFDRHQFIGIDDYYYWLRISLSGGRFAALRQPTAVHCHRPDSLGRSRATEIASQMPRLRDALAQEFPDRLRPGTPGAAREAP